MKCNYVYTINITYFSGETRIMMYVSTLERAEIHLKRFQENKLKKYRCEYKCHYYISKIRVEI